MSSVAFRGLRLALGILFVVGAAVFAAPNAHAQWTQSDACIWPSDVPALFYGTFNGLPNCEALCKKTASYCRKFVKDGASCWQNNNTGIYAVYQKQQCANLQDPMQKDDCNQFVKQGKALVKGEISSSVDDGLASCDDYQNSCLMNCSLAVQ